MDFSSAAKYLQLRLKQAQNAKEGSEEALDPFAQDVLRRYLGVVRRGIGADVATQTTLMGQILDILTDAQNQAFSNPENVKGCMQAWNIMAPFLGVNDDEESDEESSSSGNTTTSSGGQLYDRYEQLRAAENSYIRAEKKSNPKRARQGFKFIAIASAVILAAIFFAPRALPFFQSLSNQPNESPSTNDISFEIIMEGTTFKTASTGNTHTMAIDTNGNLYVWGENSSGQLGDGTTTGKRRPFIIMEGTTFASVSVGSGRGHSMAIDTEGNLWAWGDNAHGQLGDGTTDSRLRPVKIMEGTFFTRVSTSRRHTMAIDTNGNLWAWGDNSYGQLGDGTRDNSLTPVKIAEGTTFAYVSAGIYSSMGHRYNIINAAIDTNGNLWQWGSIQLNNTRWSSRTPRQIEANTTFASVSASGTYLMAKDINGRLWAWGNNNFGQLGDGAGITGFGRNDRFDNPIMVMEHAVFASVSTGRHTTLAIDENGSLLAWGFSNTAFDSIMQHMEDKEFAHVSMSILASVRVAAIDRNGNLWVTKE